MKENRIGIAIAGGIIGIAAVILVLMGNPLNMGFCIACFWRDLAGGIGLHRAEVVQYIRPEVIGLLLGSFIISSIKGEFKSKGGSSTMTRFFMGVFMMIGALVFLGCPLRAILRLSNGDLNALIGLIGFTFGIFIGTLFIRRGFSLGKKVEQDIISGISMPVLMFFFLVLLLVAPSFIFFSVEGPGSMHAPIFLSLAIGLIIGAIAQRVRFCTSGGIRDLFLIKNMTLFIGVIAVFLMSLIGNLIFNFENFNLGFSDQPIAHTEHIWNFIGLMLVGLSSSLLGGCPLRQTILAGTGDFDSASVVLGMIVGAAICHNFNLAASPKGVPLNGKVAVLIAIAITIIIGLVGIRKKKTDFSR
ncbi:MAG: YedE family putative selenium transporter [Andreesenia angusta]|nr:YedE family putative selenium transporter [Andreesenia angusta]